ncbi:MAG: ABC transporter permease, partial [Acidobacteriota bacterium]
MADRLARILLRLYPETFRTRFGRELLQIWRLERADAGSAGRWAAMSFWLRWLPATFFDALGLRLRRDPSQPIFPKSKDDWTMHAFRRDVSFTFRSLGRQPGWCLAVACTLAVGLGAGTAIFSIVNDALLRPLPYPRADRLVVVEPVIPESRRVVPACFPAYEDFRQAQSGLERLDTWSEETAIVDLGGGPERRQVALTAAGLLDTLRLDVEIGRSFSAADDALGGEPVALLGYRLWQSAFGGDPGVLGRRISVDEVVHTVIGILPEGLAFPDVETDLWLPLSGAPREPTFYYLSMIGRLDDGVSVEQLNARFSTLDTKMPNGDRLSPIDLRATSMREVLVGDFRPQLAVFLAAVLAVLLIACSNAAHLILTRTIGRRRELSLRAALGAGRSQLARQLAIEGGVLGVLGGVVGLGLAAAVLEVLRRLGPDWMPRPETLGLDATAVTVGLVAAVGIGMALGLLTALPAASKHPTLGLGSTRGTVAVEGQRIRSTLIVVQVAGAVVLLGVAFLLISTFREIERRESGFDSAGTLVVDIDLPDRRYGTVDAQRAYYGRLLESLRSLPGVTSATVASSHPFTFYINQGFTIDGY